MPTVSCQTVVTLAVHSDVVWLPEVRAAGKEGTIAANQC